MTKLAWLGAVAALSRVFPTPLHSESSTWNDPSTHRVQFVVVEGDVKLEVLDWGGSGRSLILLAGLGNTAHVFDDFAPKLTSDYHVYGITRRGFGASSMPGSGYEADRLGDDVQVVLDSLELNHAVLVGHSLGGQELSSVGSRHPDRVAGLVYLDAGYQYAFDDGNGVAMQELQKHPPPEPPPPGVADMASFFALQAWYLRNYGFTFPEAEFRQSADPGPDGKVIRRYSPPRIEEAIQIGMRKYTDIRVPALVIYAIPHSIGPWVLSNKDPTVRAAAEAFSANEVALTEKQAKAFEHGVPTAHVVRLPRADHYVFLSNEADVMREMRAFLSSLH